MNQPVYRAAVFGATSAIASEFLRALCEDHEAELLLFGRDESRLEATAADLRARGATCTVRTADFLDFEHDWKAELDGPTWDLFLVAHGSLPDQDRSLGEGAAIAREIGVNFTSQAVIAAACAEILDRQGHGRLAVIGSVAGDRGRASNFLYGSAKAGIAAFMAGLQHRFAERQAIHVSLLKPGMTDTPMTADLPKGPLFSPASKVGRLGWKAVRSGKPTAYLPGWWAGVMTVVRSLPSSVLHKTKL